jgi:hypothetical protein
MGELENWRLEDWKERAESVEVRKTGVKLKRVVSGWILVVVDVVRVRRKGVVAGRWTRVRSARRAIGESSCGMLTGLGWTRNLLFGMEVENIGGIVAVM